MYNCTYILVFIVLLLAFLGYKFLVALCICFLLSQVTYLDTTSFFSAVEQCEKRTYTAVGMCVKFHNLKNIDGFAI